MKKLLKHFHQNIVDKNRIIIKGNEKNAVIIQIEKEIKTQFEKIVKKL